MDGPGISWPAPPLWHTAAACVGATSTEVLAPTRLLSAPWLCTPASGANWAFCAGLPHGDRPRISRRRQAGRGRPLLQSLTVPLSCRWQPAAGYPACCAIPRSAPSSHPLPYLTAPAPTRPPSWSRRPCSGCRGRGGHGAAGGRQGGAGAWYPMLLAPAVQVGP